MTRDQLAAELSRIARMQISDITRAVKNGDKAIALNEIGDLARRLNQFADAIAGTTAAGTTAPATAAPLPRAPLPTTAASRDRVVGAA